MVDVVEVEGVRARIVLANCSAVVIIKTVSESSEIRCCLTSGRE